MINIKELKNAKIARENAKIAKIAKRTAIKTAIVEKAKELFFQGIGITILGIGFLLIFRYGYLKV